MSASTPAVELAATRVGAAQQCQCAVANLPWQASASQCLIKARLLNQTDVFYRIVCTKLCGQEMRVTVEHNIARLGAWRGPCALALNPGMAST